MSDCRKPDNYHTIQYIHLGYPFKENTHVRVMQVKEKWTNFWKLL